MDEKCRYLTKMSIGDVLDYSIEIYKRNFKKITILALYFYVPFIFLYTLVISYFSSDLISNSIVPGKIGSSSSFPFTIMAFYLIIMVMGFLYLIYSITLKSVMDASIAKIVYSDVTLGNVSALKTIIKDCFKRFSSLLANRVLSYLIIMGIVLGAYFVMVIIILVFTVGGVFLSTSFQKGEGAQINTAGAVIAGIFIGLIVVAIFLAILLLVTYIIARYSMGIQSVIIENKTATEGISRCNSLVKKNFWHVSMTYIFGVLLFYTIPTLLTYGAQSLLLVSRNLFIAAATLVQIATAVINPFITVLLTVLFINLKIKSEGLDLELKVDILLEEQRARETMLGNGETTNA